jgi:hypothetical protein
LAPVLKKAKPSVSAGNQTIPMNNTDFIYCEDMTATADALVSYYALDSRKDTPYLLPKISNPILVFAGTEDQVVTALDQTLAPMAEAGTVELEKRAATSG